MSYRCFDLEITDQVAHVRLIRPAELNSLIPEFWRELPEIVGALSARGHARAVVVSSTGRHFSAGMDLAVFSGGPGDSAAEAGRRNAALRQTVLGLQRCFDVVEQARMPVLAAIQGGCIGGALDLACACDLRYASADAFFCIQEINIGMTADLGTLQRLPTLIPAGVARELAYTGRRLPAARAYEVGLVQQVFPDHDSLVAGVLDIAAEIATKSPLAIWGSKVAMTYARDHGVADGLAQIASWQSGMFQPADMAEAFAAKAQGRPAVYADLLTESEGV